MREPKQADSGWHRCDCCDTIWFHKALLDIADYFQRVDAGGFTPSGECPDPKCGALCYPSKPNKVKDRKTNGLGKGFCSEHGEFRMDSETDQCPKCEEIDIKREIRNQTP